MKTNKQTNKKYTGIYTRTKYNNDQLIKHLPCVY